ncbi:MAG: DUF3149 domain-containing protein [Colwellia sp.]|nr:DUF3149 domain-containing protein [Colwellia sp.]
MTEQIILIVLGICAYYVYYFIKHINEDQTDSQR